MEHTNSLQQVAKDAAAEMERIGYSASSMKHYHEVWNRYLKFTVSNTLASNLLRQGTPLPVISGILGHRDSVTTMEYLRIDMEQRV